MQPDISAGNIIRRVARKEITLFFASPIAYLFLITFSAVSLFVFFWGEAFFSRNIADVRPLFEWMPLLLIFLSATLTMRMWSEERRTGTLEHVITQAVPLWHFVIGKFVACMVLLVMALLVTMPLPLTVAMLGELDWGPVVAGYLATLLLGAAYLSIGLCVSARSDNQIVSLISAVAVCYLFYLVGTPTITDFFGNRLGETLRLLGTGSRFESITRGVVDLRDLSFYLSLVAVFLVLNTYLLERERWADTGERKYHQRCVRVTGLLIVNVLLVNVWLGQVRSLRVDMTAGNQYSISPATEGYLSQLREPLLLRGYFSAKTHPLLAPLVPQLRDLMSEYEIAGGDRVRVEFVDPVADPELEQEANQKYGIQPVPFQVADRYQSSIVSSYFNVLVQYGDEYEVLGFRDLIEIQARAEADIDVQLRNPEHDLTRAIKKVLHGYQAGGNLFETVQGELDFTAYISADALLPEQLIAFRQTVEDTVAEFSEQSSGRLRFNVIDPDADQGAVGERIAEEFGFMPMATSLFSQQRFYYYLTLSRDDQVIQIPLEDMTEDGLKRNIEAAIKRFATGFTKTVALVLPDSPPQISPYIPASGPGFAQLEAALSADLNVEREDISDGTVTGAADILVLAAPRELDELGLFAVDQFLMQGGTVLVASSPFSASLAGGRLSLSRQDSGLSDWLAHHGFRIGEELVLDSQNAAFPIPVTRNIGGFQLQEMRMLDYPYFVDVRAPGLNQDSMITSELPQATMTWASPIEVDSPAQGDRKLTRLLQSSPDAWVSPSTDIMPSMDANGLSPFTPAASRGAYLLGVVSEGRFNSYFAGQDSPILNSTGQPGVSADEPGAEAEEITPEEQISGVIERSPESSRLILFSSNNFLEDQILQFAAAANQGEYLNTLQMMTNAVEWSLEDAGLLSIRSRSHFNRTLPPLEHNSQLFWEYLNYALAILAVGAIAFLERSYRRKWQRRHLALLGQ